MSDTPKTAVVVIDMLNCYDHEDAEPLLESARTAVPAIGRLLERAREAGVLIVFVNDNFGDWTTGRSQLIERTRDCVGPELIDPIAPSEDIPFLLKARHSAFYGTPLEYLLRSEDIERVVLGGQATEQCILYSALDAYVRHFDVAVPRDAVAHIDEDLAKAALRMMESNMRAEIADADTVQL
ncbi:MAG TPA: isochorismatase family cysteine hydrolase [Solirubrobacteraceae bacterium]